MELLRALGSLIEPPSPQHAGVAAALGLPEPPSPWEHQRVVASQRWPYASVYLGAEGMMGGEARARIAGFHRALGLDRTLGSDRNRTPAAAEDGSTDGGNADGATEVDHLPALLDLLASLDRWRGDGRPLATRPSPGPGPTSPGSSPGHSRSRDSAPDASHRALLAHATSALVQEHLTPWLRPYLASFDGCGSAFYEAWAALLGRVLDAVEADMEERPARPQRPELAEHLPAALPVAPPATPSAVLPAALRAAPGLPDPRRASGDAFVAGLLAPVRCGMVLVRDDLTRLAHDAGLACRAGERRYALAGLLAQDPGATLLRLARRAEEWRDRLAGRGPARIAEWWSARAGGTALLLSRLAREATSTEVGP